MKWLETTVVLATVGIPSAQVGSRTASPSPPRAEVRGKVLTAEGKPRSGARVSLFSRRIASGASQGPIDTEWGVDRVEASTDDAGRFVAHILPDQEYAAWSVSEAERGLVRITPPTLAVFAGAQVALCEPDQATPLDRIVVTGLAAWKEHAPLVLRVLSLRAPVWSVDLPIADDSVTLPAAPWRDLELQLRPRGGAPVWFRRVDRDTPKTLRVELPPPTPLRVDVVRALDEKPIAGATVGVATNGVTWPLAVTDANGVCTVVLAGPASRFGSGNMHHLLVIGPGCAAMRWNPNEHYRRDHVLDETGLHLRLFPGGVLRGRVLSGPTVAMQRSPLLLSSMVHAGAEGQVVGRGPFLACTDEDGAFAIPGMAAKKQAEVWGVLSAEWARALAGEGSPVQTAVPFAASETSADGDTDVGVISLDRFAAMEARWQLPDGTPAERAWVGMEVPAWKLARSATAARSDRSGRARWLVPKEMEVVVGGLSEGMFGAMTLSAPGRADVQLAPLPAVAGKLVDAGTHAPLGGVPFGLSYGLQGGEPADRLSSMLLFAWHGAQSKVTGPDGRFVVHHPRTAIDCRLQFRPRVDGKQRIHNEVVDPGAQDLEVQFR